VSRVLSQSTLRLVIGPLAGARDQLEPMRACPGPLDGISGSAGCSWGEGSTPTSGQEPQNFWGHRQHMESCPVTGDTSRLQGKRPLSGLAFSSSGKPGPPPCGFVTPDLVLLPCPTALHPMLENPHTGCP
jgi:hypothetical protein